MTTRESTTIAAAGLGALVAVLTLCGAFLIGDKRDTPQAPPHQSEEMWRLFGRR
jgi:hypothetical protein